MKIHNSLHVARWEKLDCVCKKDKETTCYPFVKCERCKYQEAWDSVPQKNFKINTFDEDGKKTGTKTVKEIKLVRGHDLQDVIGWSFS
jgi:hypothetical protein